MGASSNGEGLGLLNREWQFESARAYHLVPIHGVTGSAWEKTATTRFRGCVDVSGLASPVNPRVARSPGPASAP
jgi:hypothetical protein